MDRPATDPTKVATPDLIGLSLAEAVATAGGQGFVVNEVHVVSGRGQTGVVVGQSPSPGFPLRSQWRIHVLVADRPLTASADASADGIQERQGD